MNNIHILLLAAGASKRMKQPKQLLHWGDTSLLQHQITTLMKLNVPLTVVLGAYVSDIQKTVLPSEKVNIIKNPSWEQGLGNSIAFGVKQFLKGSQEVDGIMIVLADQPLVTLPHYQKIIATFQPDKKQIVVSQSPEGISSPPALFDYYYFQFLEKLEGDHGAMPIVKTNKENVTYIPSENLEDMDTPEQYEKLKSKME